MVVAVVAWHGNVFSLHLVECVDANANGTSIDVAMAAGYCAVGLVAICWILADHLVACQRELMPCILQWEVSAETIERELELCRQVKRSPHINNDCSVTAFVWRCNYVSCRWSADCFETRVASTLNLFTSRYVLQAMTNWYLKQTRESTMESRIPKCILPFNVTNWSTYRKRQCRMRWST